MIRIKRYARRRVAVLGMLVAILASALGFVASAGPASAHSGGRAIVFVRSLTLTPASGGWQANLTITDSDSGDPIQGSRVTLAMTGAPAAKAVTLSGGSTPGAYEGTLSGAKAGASEIELKVRTAPGQAAVAAFDKKYPVNLVDGEPVTVVAGGGGGGSNLPLIMGVAAAVLAVALLYGLYSVRRRTAVPVRAK